MNVARIARMAIGGAAVAVLAACSHSITIEPQTMPTRTESSLVKKRVAYVMSDTERQKEITTSGGGGDKVSYYPFRDFEKALRETLRSIYDDVTLLKSASDAAAVRESGAQLIFSPQITTTSSSPSLLTWPPTKFTFEVACSVTDPSGAVVVELRVAGQGTSEFDEFKGDTGLSGKRATAQAMQKLREEIMGNPKLVGSDKMVTAPATLEAAALEH